MDFISNLVIKVIQTLYHFLGGFGFPNYGLAIVLMTVIIKIILFPLTKKQIESTRAMMSIQPKMKEIQEKYKNDKVRLNQELAKLYKDQGVNPMYILPVVSAVTTYIQAKQTMPKKNPNDKQQDGLMGMMQGQMMTYFMPLFIGYISLSFPAALVLYWIVMNIMQIAQQAYINSQMDRK